MSITISGAELLEGFKSMRIAQRELPHEQLTLNTNMAQIANLFQGAWHEAVKLKREAKEEDDQRKSVTTETQS